jgi:hypothetical protein
MIIKRNGSIENDAIKNNIRRLLNQTFKLLPLREEESNWEKSLDSILEELTGMDSLLIGKHEILFSLLCKLEGLYSLTKKEDFPLYRKIIFECLTLFEELKESF